MAFLGIVVEYSAAIFFFLTEECVAWIDLSVRLYRLRGNQVSLVACNCCFLFPPTDNILNCIAFNTDGNFSRHLANTACPKLWLFPTLNCPTKLYWQAKFRKGINYFIFRKLLSILFLFSLQCSSFLDY